MMRDNLYIIKEPTPVWKKAWKMAFNNEFSGALSEKTSHIFWAVYGKKINPGIRLQTGSLGSHTSFQIENTTRWTGGNP
jgi:hypothetical protein